MRPVRVAIVQHCEQSTDRLDDALAVIGAEVVRHRLDLGDPVPFDGDYDRVVILGGVMGAYDLALHPWLGAEKDWIRELVKQDTPVLGICLGAQLLADSLGGEAYVTEWPEAGVVSLRLSAAGAADPVMAAGGTRVYSLHQDTFSLPEGATLLAETERFPHAFRMGSALALQFHPDANLDLALKWGGDESPILRRAGVAFEDYAKELVEADADLEESSRSLFRAWLEYS
jgi:GMP synthase (glutamine-hydrolysing)